MRILFYTHRFGKDVVGGAELHLWNLAEHMARMGCRVDVATPARTNLAPLMRFGEHWWGEPQKAHETIDIRGANHPIEIHRFPVYNLPKPLAAFLQKSLQRRWEREELEMEPAEPLPTHFVARSPLLLTGWHLPEQMDDNRLARWTMQRAAIQLPEVQEAALHLQGFAPRQVTLEFERLGQRRIVFRGKGHFQINVKIEDAPRSTIGILHVHPTLQPLRDTRRLGVQFTQLSLSSQGRIQLTPFHVDHRSLRAQDKKAFIETYVRRAEARPRFYSRLFDLLRGPICPGMAHFLKKNGANYDWVIAGILPFATLPSAARSRARRSFSLALLPLFHVDDDFYYWRHYLDVLRDADVCLANSWFSNENFFPAIGARSFPAGAGVDDTLFQKSTISGERFRKRYGFGPDEKIVLSVGRKSGTKLYRTVAKAVNNIQHHVPCRFVLIGPDEDQRAISYPSTSYLGKLPEDDLLDAYDACDVFCLMSESESFGMVFVEAWMRCKPVIGNSNCAPVAYLVHHDRNGMLASTREELQDQLIGLLNDPERCRAYGEAGRQQALRAHTWQVIARKILDYFETASPH